MLVFATKTHERGRSTHIPSGALCRRALTALHVGLIFVEDGEAVWANRAAVSLLGVDNGTDGSWREIAQAAMRLPHRPGPRSAPTMRSLGTVRSSAGQLRLCGVRLPSTRSAGAELVLVAVELSHRRPAGDAQLRHRYGLTPQELQVARLLAEGLTNSRLAEALGITPNTARIHTERVLRKLGVHSRAAVASTILHA